MHLLGVWLQNFRKFTNQAFKFARPVVVVFGPNAAGKSSLLEAIQLISTGNSFRAGKIEEMVRFENELGRVQLKIMEDAGRSVTSSKSRPGSSESESKLETPDSEDSEDATTLEVVVNTGQVQGKRTQKRLFSVNGARRRRADLVGRFLTVVFRPEDMRLVEGSPARRRSFLDVPLCLASRSYERSLKTYEQTLIRRNKLLFQVREGEAPRSTLTYWDLTLLKHGQILQEARREFLGSFTHFGFDLSLRVEYLPSVISAKRQEEYLSREIAAGHCLIGPHKDDFILTFLGAGASKPHNLALYGSRGQQRLGVLWLKIGELLYLESKLSQPVVLLLDDILSELDLAARDLVLELLTNRQAIVTVADPQVLGWLQDKKLAFDLINLD